MARRAAKIEEVRSESEHTLVLDAGNSLFGDKYFSEESEGATSVEAMNLMGYDAAALALGDLAMGLDTLRERIEQASFPFLSANMRVQGSDTLVGQAYTVRAIGGHQVAIVGLTESGEADGVTIDDPLAAARGIMPQVREEADIVILLTHTPVSVARGIAQEVPGIDLVVTGGNERLGVGEMIGEQTLIVHADVASPGHAGRNLGIVKAQFDGQGHLTEQTNTVVVLSETLPEDPDMAQWVVDQAARQAEQ